MLLKFDARLYTREAVEAAAESFAEFAAVEVSEDGPVLKVELRPIGEADPELADEFANHVLGGMSR